MKQRPKFRAQELPDSNDSKYVNNEEGTELTTRQQSNQRTIDTPINEGDTLQSLSIRYHCPVSELKRLNNIHRENEIFARRTLRVPFRAFSMVAVHKSGDSSPDVSLPKKSVDPIILKQKLSSVSGIASVGNGHVVDSNLVDFGSNDQVASSFNEIIFNTRIADKEASDDGTEETVSDEEIQLLPNIEVAEPVSSEYSCSGADWGLSWPLLLAIVLIVAFVGPLIYIFYIAEHPEQYHHHT